MTQTPRIGVCGLGNMGSAISHRLVGSFPVRGYDISETARMRARERGLEVVETYAGLKDCDIVLLSLPHAEASREAASALAGTLHSRATVLETSTVAPEDVAAMASVLSAADIVIIDAAIISGVPAMAAGDSSMLVGGHAGSADDGVRAVLDILCTKVTWTGAIGSAMAMKVIHNAVAHATMVTLAEARALGQSHGITESALVEMLRGAEAGLLRPLLHRLGERVPAHDYAGGMSLAAARKDSILALGMAAEQGIPLYSIAASHTAYENAMRKFDGRDDYAVIAELWREE